MVVVTIIFVECNINLLTTGRNTNCAISFITRIVIFNLRCHVYEYSGIVGYLSLFSYIFFLLGVTAYDPD